MINLSAEGGHFESVSYRDNGRLSLGELIKELHLCLCLRGDRAQTKQMPAVLRLNLLAALTPLMSPAGTNRLPSFGSLQVHNSLHLSLIRCKSLQTLAFEFK